MNPAEETIAAHVFDGCDYCSCGERYERRDYPAHVIAALSSAGFVVLPSVRRAAEARAVSGDEKPIAEEVDELLPEHRDRMWRDKYGYTWAWIKWASQEWDWGMREAECLPRRRCFYNGRSYRSPFKTIAGSVSGDEK